MKPTIIFATGNPNKVAEVHQLLKGTMDIKSLKDIGFTEEVPEDFETLEENAIQKARYFYDRFQTDCFSEDTGLEIEALGGAPGVHTAYYGGPQRNATDNMDKVLDELKNEDNRNARFRTVVALILNGHLHTFEGIVNGQIAHAKTGDQGFGYDPIFIPEGYTTSFAEMDKATKNGMSHRGRAIAKLVDFLTA